FFFAGRTLYSGLKLFFSSTPSFDFGRSRTCPIEALTRYFESRYFWIVLTFVGDSTTTSDRFATPFPLSSCPQPNEPLSLDPADVPVELQRQQECGGPSGGHACLLDDIVHRRGLGAKHSEQPRGVSVLPCPTILARPRHARGPRAGHALAPARRQSCYDIFP